MTPEERERIRQELQEYATDTISGWLDRCLFLQTPENHEGLYARIEWEIVTDGAVIATLTGDYGAEEFGRYGVTVTVEALPDLPPLGPENDPAQQFELSWYPRTYADVRIWDTIKHTETAPEAVVLSCSQERRHVRDGGTGRHWDDKAIEHDLTRVRLDYPGAQMGADGRPRILDIPAATPVLIKLTAEEFSAIELLGWSNRKGLPD